MEFNPKHFIIIFILYFTLVCHYYFAKEKIIEIYTKKVR